MNQTTLKDRFELFKSFVAKHKSFDVAIKELYSDNTGVIEKDDEIEIQEANESQYNLLDKLDDQLSDILKSIVGIPNQKFDSIVKKKDFNKVIELLRRHIELMTFA